MLTGSVLTSEGVPIPSGTVSMQSLGSERQVTIDSNGRFRFEGLAPGLYDMHVSAPRLMAHRLKIAISSRKVGVAADQAVSSGVRPRETGEPGG